MFQRLNGLKLTDYFEEENFVEDNAYIIAFLFIYDSFIKHLQTKKYVNVINYPFINWKNEEEIYQKFHTIYNMELLSSTSQNVKITMLDKEKFINYIKKFSICLQIAYASIFNNDELIKLFKEKATPEKFMKTIDEKEKIDNISDESSFYMCPVYGKISAGLPNWAEECLDGYLPIDPNLMGIVDPEECFFLRVDGESMNKVIRNGAYALIRKQDIVENGEIAVVLVNEFNATLKKFSQQGDLVILEPISNDNSFTTQVYGKDTDIKILGKYIGKFEINK